MQNVQFKHTSKTNRILLYDMASDYLRAAFLTKEKPKEGDLFQTWTKADTNFVYTFRIVNIVNISDSQANAVKELQKEKGTKKKPGKGFINVIKTVDNTFHENALIEANIEMLNIVHENGVISGKLKDGLEVEDEIRNFY